jgi:hypothetical protein
MRSNVSPRSPETNSTERPRNAWPPPQPKPVCSVASFAATTMLSPRTAAVMGLSVTVVVGSGEKQAGRTSEARSTLRMPTPSAAKVPVRGRVISRGYTRRPQIFDADLRGFP